MTQKKRCFVIMPFGKKGTPEYQRNLKVYRLMIKPVVESCGYQSIRADELEQLGSITRDIIQLLQSSDLVVADLSGKNANVFYELGVRHALFRCGTIPIIREGELLPFDIANYRAIFYSSELDGPDEFREELKRRIDAFERVQKKTSDNPVHDILGDRLKWFDPKEFIARKDHDEKIGEIQTLTRQIEDLERKRQKSATDRELVEKKLQTNSKQKNAEIAKLKRRIETLEAELQKSKISQQDVPISTLVAPFRSEPKELSSEDAKAMLKEKDFFDSDHNKSGKGFANQYERKSLGGDKVVMDHASGLMWQQGGSSKYVDHEDAKKWIEDLNQKGYAGHKDWRLPTLEEAMSLMEPEKKHGDLYIDPVFDKTQRYIWTADMVKGERWAWVVYFDYGYCYYSTLGNFYSVRAVRSGQSSGG